MPREIGVYGIDAGSENYNSGVIGTSANGSGVSGLGLAGVSGTGGIVGVQGTSSFIGGDFSSTGDGLALSLLNTGTGPLIDAVGVYGEGLSRTVFRVDNAGNETIAGALTTNSYVSAVTKTTSGDVVSYATRSASPAIEDVGKGELQNGGATITEFERPVYDRPSERLRRIRE